MSANVGLSTPRGSGTSGYVQRNLSLLKQATRDRGAPYPSDPDEFKKHRQRQPDPEILEHDRKRRIENKVFELRDQLEDEGVEEDEIDAQTDALRKKLEAEDQADSSSGRGTAGKAKARGLKSHQVHDLAQAKIEETENLRRALGISKDYEEGSHWRKQEERLRESAKVPEPVPRAKSREDSPRNDRSRRRSDHDSSEYDSDSSRSYSD